mmetsp:Transcript_6651/g.12995  ORF Transcript_6651/g.12995 Transcript_6651/m.12995 type:complete len:204 (-) Transcript_6651:248-859(-)
MSNCCFSAASLSRSTTRRFNSSIPPGALIVVRNSSFSANRAAMAISNFDSFSLAVDSSLRVPWSALSEDATRSRSSRSFPLASSTRSWKSLSLFSTWVFRSSISARYALILDSTSTHCLSFSDSFFSISAILRSLSSSLRSSSGSFPSLSMHRCKASFSFAVASAKAASVDASLRVSSSWATRISVSEWELVWRVCCNASTSP